MFTAIPDCDASAELSGGARPCALSLQVICPSLQGPNGQNLLCFSRLTDKAVKDYSAYRSSLLFWALVDLIYNMFKVRSFGAHQLRGLEDVCVLGLNPLGGHSPKLLTGFGFFALESLHLGRGEHPQLRPSLPAVSS